MMADWRVLLGLPSPTVLRRHGGHHDGDGEKEDEEAHIDGERHHALSELFWYSLIGVLVVALVLRLARAWMARRRIAQSQVTAGSPARALSHGDLPRILSPAYWAKWRPSFLAAVPLARVFIVIIYSLFVTRLIMWKAIKHDEKYIERLGFRSGWITTTQTTLCFLLAARANPIGLVLGTSYDRMNWLHRWASRVFFASASVHGTFFSIQWVANGFGWEEPETGAAFLWGIVAWVVLLWTLLSSLVPFRRWRYEFFVFQHIASAVVLLAVLFLHVPEHHHFSVWCAAVAFLYDVLTRSSNPLWRNVRLRLPSRALGRIPRYAYTVKVEAVDEELTVLTIRAVSFKWTAGQHILVWTPEFKLQSPHPFTIASATDTEQPTQDVTLVAKTKTGVTQELNHWARQRRDMGESGDMRFLVAGPYGSMPNWRRFDSLVLIAGSTGGSFTTAVLEDLLTSRQPGCLRRITSLLVVRRKVHASVYLQKLSQIMTTAKDLGVLVNFEVAVTGVQASVHDARHTGSESYARPKEADSPAAEDGHLLQDLPRTSTESFQSLDSAGSEAMLKDEGEIESLDDLAIDTSIYETHGRPDVAALIRREAGMSSGHISVAVCAGGAIENIVKRSVASLSASSYADGLDISLHVERAN